VNANGFLKSKMQKLETQVLKSRFSYNNLTEREITFYTGLNDSGMLEYIISFSDQMIKPFRQFAIFGIHWFIILETNVSDKLNRNAKSLFNKPKRSFKPNYKKVVSTIDCFEVFMERPHNLTARAQTWSNYKQQTQTKLH
jgi:hypothetical protein